MSRYVDRQTDRSRALRAESGGGEQRTTEMGRGRLAGDNRERARVASSPHLAHLASAVAGDKVSNCQVPKGKPAESCVC